MTQCYTNFCPVDVATFLSDYQNGADMTDEEIRHGFQHVVDSGLYHQIDWLKRDVRLMISRGELGETIYLNGSPYHLFVERNKPYHWSVRDRETGETVAMLKGSVHNRRDLIRKLENILNGPQ